MHKNARTLAYIVQDDATEHKVVENNEESGKKVSYKKAFRHKQTWAFAFGKFMTDGVWWFLLFWLPAYLSSVYNLDSTQSAVHIFVVYAISMFAIVAGGFLPAYFMEKKKTYLTFGSLEAGKNSLIGSTGKKFVLTCFFSTIT